MAFQIDRTITKISHLILKESLGLNKNLSHEVFNFFFSYWNFVVSSSSSSSSSSSFLFISSVDYSFDISFEEPLDLSADWICLLDLRESYRSSLLDFRVLYFSLSWYELKASEFIYPWFSNFLYSEIPLPGILFESCLMTSLTLLSPKSLTILLNAPPGG